MAVAQCEVVVVLGCHRSGTSAVASILDALGVNMGTRTLGAAPSNPWGHCEDKEFLGLNVRILKALAGLWRDIPSGPYLDKLPENLLRELENLVMKKSESTLWGWKDPRTSLLLDVYKPYLFKCYPEHGSVRFIRSHRRQQDIVRSLMQRDGDGDWPSLVRTYNRRIEEQIGDIPTLDVQFEALLNPDLSRDIVVGINGFVGTDEGQIDMAMQRIHYPDE